MDKKVLFNFYVEEQDKMDAQAKLERVIGETEKGMLAAFLRTCIKQFIETPDNEVNAKFLSDLSEEYTYSLVRNKRSKL